MANENNDAKKRRLTIENAGRGTVISYQDDKGREAYMIVDSVQGGRVYGEVVVPTNSDSMSISDLVERNATVNVKWKNT